MSITPSIEHLSYAEYDARPGLRASQIWRMVEWSPAHAALACPDSGSMSLGRAVHCLLLEPGEYPARYWTAGKLDRRTKSGKALANSMEDAHPGAEFLKPEDAGNADGMLKSIRRHKVANNLLFSGPGDNEVSVFWDMDGVPCKARLDRCTPDSVIDLKTCRDARSHAFSRAAFGDYGYFLSLYFYSLGLSALGRPVKNLYLVAVETDPPHGVNVYLLDTAAQELAHEKIHAALDLYRKHAETEPWPAYPEVVTPLLLPAWKAFELSDE